MEREGSPLKYVATALCSTELGRILLTSPQKGRGRDRKREGSPLNCVVTALSSTELGTILLRISKRGRDRDRKREGKRGLTSEVCCHSPLQHRVRQDITSKSES